MRLSSKVCSFGVDIDAIGFILYWLTGEARYVYYISVIGLVFIFIALYMLIRLNK